DCGRFGLDGDAAGISKLRRSPDAVGQAGVSAVARDRRNQTGCQIDSADRLVSAVGNPNSSALVHCDSPRTSEGCAQSISITIPLAASTWKYFNAPIGAILHSADGMICGVADIKGCSGLGKKCRVAELRLKPQIIG